MVILDNLGNSTTVTASVEQGFGIAIRTVISGFYCCCLGLLIVN